MRTWSTSPVIHRQGPLPSAAAAREAGGARCICAAQYTCKVPVYFFSKAASPFLLRACCACESFTSDSNDRGSWIASSDKTCDKPGKGQPEVRSVRVGYGAVEISIQ